MEMPVNVGFQHSYVLELILQALTTGPVIGRIRGKQSENKNKKLKTNVEIWNLSNQPSTQTI